MSVWHPKYETIDHINIYSKSKSPLGRALSNFFYSAFVHPDFGVFKSVEGFYYYLLTGEIHEELKDLHGLAAKRFGESKTVLTKINKQFKLRMQEAICYKIISNDYIQNLLVESDLPLTHYYYYGERSENPKVYDMSKEHAYMVHAIEEIRIRLQQDGKVHRTQNQPKRDGTPRKVHNKFKDL
jgi:hypothetical protein